MRNCCIITLQAHFDQLPEKDEAVDSNSRDMTMSVEHISYPLQFLLVGWLLAAVAFAFELRSEIGTFWAILCQRVGW